MRSRGGEGVVRANSSPCTLVYELCHTPHHVLEGENRRDRFPIRFVRCGSNGVHCQSCLNWMASPLLLKAQVPRQFHCFSCCQTDHVSSMRTGTRGDESVQLEQTSCFMLDTTGTPQCNSPTSFLVGLFGQLESPANFLKQTAKTHKGLQQPQ